MAASDSNNMAVAAMEQWCYRPTASFQDSWISEAFARDTKALTLALQKSMSNSDAADVTDMMLMPFYNNCHQQPEVTPITTPTVSGVSGSDPESGGPKRRGGNNAIPATGKVTKRKSRASKRTQTTFITADPANFRQMVQQVTGVRFNGAVQTIVKPEPQRVGGGGRVLPGGGCLPTLDTSAFLLDHYQQQQQQGVGPASARSGPVGSNCYGGSVSVEVAEGGVSSGGLGFDSSASKSISSFPTLESWKVM